MVYQLPRLPFKVDALEPYIDARTMTIHHCKHHAGYIRKLNDLLKGRPRLLAMTLEDIIANIRSVPEDIRQQLRDNGGGHLNHSLFWQVLGTGGQDAPAGRVMEAIGASFGDFPAFRQKFTTAAMTRFGSGWAWLCVDADGKLEVFSTPNQDSPIMLGYRPILGLDVWEHAYYLKYRNNRADYVEAFWHMVNWNGVAEIYSHLQETARVQ